ncbi:MAG: ATP-binding cassette domain-containing protein [Pseudonocardia sp.]|uniref:branched-chain amino acid ABC transporter permease/ATP-binding protein n=1 Tax=unclassified Pseudonocardia TaxID=2619320 RepID=UPI001ACD8C61|nr:MULTISPECIES: branched-chain amino acid ABC transporter permease/ATP-binding protein [unclassified Pseudonocardia]MBN9109390.1 ATP-binding cassette domain-containing protein [Pseudonocardia sp.]
MTVGSVYGLAGVGLVLTYKTSGIFNFAHGALATVSAYLFYSLHVQLGMHWVPAALITLVVGGAGLGLFFERLARSLQGTSLATKVVATLGVLLVVQGTVTVVYGLTETRVVPTFLPSNTFTVFGTTIALPNLIIFVVGIVATVGLFYFFHAARLGVAMRAVVDHSDLLDMSGTNPVAVRRYAWVIGTTFAVGSGILLVSIPPPMALDPLNLTFLVVAAFGAAAVGSFKSLPATYLGGLAIGIVASLCTKYFTSGPLAGLAVSVPFLVLFLVLLTARQGRLATRAQAVRARTATWTTPPPFQIGGGVIVFAILVAAPFFAGIHLQDYTNGLAMTILFLSLGLLVRTSGQVSLAHVTFMAIGVCTFAHLTAAGWPWGVALLAAGLIAMPIGALLAIPAIRLSGVYLALATFGFGILVQYMFYTQDFMFGELSLGVEVRRPELSFLPIDTDTGYYYLVLVIALVVLLALLGIQSGRLGRLLRGLSDSPTALATNGTSVLVTRILVFCVSAFLAAIAGVLGSVALATGGVAYAGGDSYQPLFSLTYFAVVMITVGGAPWYAIIAGFGFVLPPSYIPSTETTHYLTILFGVVAIVYGMTQHQQHGIPSLQRLLDRYGRRPKLIPPTPDEAADGPAPSPPAEPGELTINGVTVAFGGLVALDDVSLDVPTGRITGLIGPNGAGKTTLFNVTSGLLQPGSGILTLDESSLANQGPAARARRGLGRTFQQVELFDSLTVRENVALGAEAAHAGTNPLAHLLATPGQKASMHTATTAALQECDILDLSDRIVGSLSSGQRRLVELARCLAGSYRILLLDEPSSGLDRAETVRFGQILTRVVAERSVGILLVEHDMSLVSEICDYIYVLDFGKMIFEGPAAEVIASPVVRAAYLGDELAEVRTATTLGQTTETRA